MNEDRKLILVLILAIVQIVVGIGLANLYAAWRCL